MTSAHYTGTVLLYVIKAVQEQRSTTGTRNIVLLLDNASSHKSRATTLYLEDKFLPVLPHPLHHPNLSPCDYWLFPLIKSRLSGHIFRRGQDMVKAVNSEMQGLPPSAYHGAIEDYIRRLRLCIESGGDYFEGY